MIKYAGYLPEWDPEFDECPPVFIAVLNDRAIKPTESAGNVPVCKGYAVLVQWLLTTFRLLPVRHSCSQSTGLLPKSQACEKTLPWRQPSPFSPD